MEKCLTVHQTHRYGIQNGQMYTNHWLKFALPFLAYLDEELANHNATRMKLAAHLTCKGITEGDVSRRFHGVNLIWNHMRYAANLWS